MSRSAIAKDELLVSAVSIERSILLLRGQRVILGGDLAVFYDVEPRVLSQAVKRNSERFPADFMFVLSEDEWQNLKSQNVISSWGGARNAPIWKSRHCEGKGATTVNSKQVPTLGDKSFESIKQTNEHGAEYWSARDLQLLLGYSQWRRFEQAIDRAITSCQQSGNRPDYHFAGAGKMIEVGKGGQRDVDDYHLSRFACYLIAQNGDPRKPEIAQAQKYFAVQARRQELNDQAATDIERLELRKQTAEEFKALSGAAQDAGVQSKMFGVFHDAGYKGLYGGLGRDAIKQRKAIPEKDNLLDRMNATELAANQFRMTQTRDKLERDGVRNQSQAIQTHEQVGKEVRDAIKRIGGTPPENIPPAEHIKEVEKRLKSATPKLELHQRETGGLLGETARKPGSD